MSRLAALALRLVGCLTLAVGLVKAEPAAPKQDAGEERRTTRTDRYGDPLPEGALARIGSIRFQHDGPIACIAFSPDGKFVASASGVIEDDILLWDAATGKEIRDFGTPETLVHDLRFSPNGRTLISSGYDRITRRWDVATGNKLRALSGVGCAPLGDGKTLALGMPAGPEKFFIRIADAGTGRERRRITGLRGLVTTLAFAGDGTLAAAAADDRGSIRLWDIATAKAIGECKGHDDAVNCLCFSPDHRVLASAAKDETIRLWDTAARKERWKLKKHPCGGHSLAFSPDGKTLATACAREPLRLLDVATGKEVRHFGDEHYQARPIVFAPGGKRLASTSAFRDSPRSVEIWDVATGTKSPEVRRAHALAVGRTFFLSDGKTLVTAGFREPVRFWEAATGRELKQFPPGPRWEECVALSADGKMLAGGGERVRVWTLGTGKKLAELRGPAGQKFDDLAFSPDGKLLAASGEGDTIQLWDMPSGRAKHALRGRGEGISGLRFLPDGKSLLAEAGETIQLWDVVSGKETRHFRNGQLGVSTVTLSPDGRLLATAAWQKQDSDLRTVLRLVQTATGREVRRWTVNPLVHALAFSPDGRSLATGEEYGGVGLWEVVSGQERRCFLGHRGTVTAVTFSPDGATLASGAADGNALVWDITGLATEGRGRPLSPDQVHSLWSELASADVGRAYGAMAALIRAGGPVLPLWKEHLSPVPAADAKRIARWVAELDSRPFAVRENATHELGRCRETAGLELRRALARGPSPEARRRIEQLLRPLEDPATSSERLRELRSVEVLEHIGTAEARQVLATLAKGAAEARLTQEAQASLERLDRRAAAAR